jgi:hypothetical protein
MPTTLPPLDSLSIFNAQPGLSLLLYPAWVILPRFYPTFLAVGEPRWVSYSYAKLYSKSNSTGINRSKQMSRGLRTPLAG